MVLEVAYNFSPGQGTARGAVWTRALGALQTMLFPPRLCGEVGSASVCWQVQLPPEWLPVYQEDASPADRQWSWRGWLLATRPPETRDDLERWFSGPAGSLNGGSGSAAGKEEWAHPAVVAWRTDLEPLCLVHAPQEAWLLVCSLLLLAVGLALQFLPLRHGVIWMVLVVFGVAAAAAGLFWPGVLPAILYGCEPGLVALAVVIGLQWLLHQRYRRQVVFLPGFKRVKSGSSLVRNGGVNRPRAEPSTVDAVPPLPSSQWTTGESPSPPGSSQTKEPAP
jgi:hypothetical protein